jgi:hypothetical protein
MNLKGELGVSWKVVLSIVVVVAMVVALLLLNGKGYYNVVYGSYVSNISFDGASAIVYLSEEVKSLNSENLSLVFSDDEGEHSYTLENTEPVQVVDLESLGISDPKSISKVELRASGAAVESVAFEKQESPFVKVYPISKAAQTAKKKSSGGGGGGSGGGSSDGGSSGGGTTPEPQVGCSVTNTTYNFTCSDGSVYWFDNCGARGSVKENCSGGCSNGICVSYLVGGFYPEVNLSDGKPINRSGAGILPWKSGISLQADGVENVDWVEEQHFYDPLYQPRGLVFINTQKADGSNQQIRLVHNINNIAVEHNNGYVLLNGSGDYDRGKIRGVFDQFFVMRWSDGRIVGPSDNWRFLFYDDSTKTSYPVDLNGVRQGDGRVMWNSTGYTSVSNPGGEGSTGIGRTPWGDSTSTRSQNTTTWYTGRKVWGDSYVHWLQVWDDDGSLGIASNSKERASDGKMFTLVINPKVPALKVASVGGAKWRFDRVTVYAMPKFLENHTLYVEVNSSTNVLLEPVNIVSGSNSILYSLNNGQSWITYSSPIDLKSIFGTSGDHLLLLKANNQQTIRYLQVRVNPPVPSANEPKDLIFVRDSVRKQQVISYVKALSWWNTKKNYFLSNEPYFSRNMPGTGQRYGQDEYGYQARNAYGHALINYVDGYNPVHYNMAVKRLLNLGYVDLLAGDAYTNNNENPIPSSEYEFTTYRDFHVYPAPMAYALLASDNHMSVIDEYEIRENLGYLAWSMIAYTSSTGYAYNSGGDMHWSAHNEVIALWTMMAMPSFSHPLFGDATGNSEKYILWDQSALGTNVSGQNAQCVPEKGSWEHFLLNLTGENRGVWPCQKRRGSHINGITEGGRWGYPVGSDRHGYEMEVFNQLAETAVLLERNGYWEKYAEKLNPNLGAYLEGRATGNYDDPYISGSGLDRYPIEGQDAFGRYGATYRLINPEMQKGSEIWNSLNKVPHTDNLALWLKNNATQPINWSDYIVSFNPNYFDKVALFLSEPQNVVDCSLVNNCASYPLAACTPDACEIGCRLDGNNCVSY